MFLLSNTKLRLAVPNKAKIFLSILHSNLYPSKKEIPNIPFPTHPKSETTFYSLNKQANKQSKKKQPNKQTKKTNNRSKKEKEKRKAIEFETSTHHEEQKLGCHWR